MPKVTWEQLNEIRHSIRYSMSEMRECQKNIDSCQRYINSRVAAFLDNCNELIDKLDDVALDKTEEAEDDKLDSERIEKK